MALFCLKLAMLINIGFKLHNHGPLLLSHPNSVSYHCSPYTPCFIELFLHTLPLEYHTWPLYCLISLHWYSSWRLAFLLLHCWFIREAFSTISPSPPGSLIFYFTFPSIFFIGKLTTDVSAPLQKSRSVVCFIHGLSSATKIVCPTQ